MFYVNIFDSVTSLRRTTHRLYSLQGVTNLLECDSFLRRFYVYSTGIPSRMFFPTRHYANSLQECKSWARATCRVSTPDELAWLRQPRSPFKCHVGVFGLFRALYHVFTRKSCDDPHGPNLISALRQTAGAMSVNQQLTRVVNGKVTYLVKTTDTLNRKVKQIINSMRALDRSFTTWNQQVVKQFKEEQCHYHSNMEFLSLYSLQMNRVITAMLRLTEIDVLRQLSRLTARISLALQIYHAS